MPAEPKYQRRKEDRPQEIADAAFSEFAKKGYSATRIDDVTVLWADGVQESFDSAGVGQTIVLRRGEGSPPSVAER